MKDSFDLIKKLMAEELRHRILLEEVKKRGDIGYLDVQDRTREGKGSEDKSSVGSQGAGEGSGKIILDKRIKMFTGNLDDLDELCARWPDPAMLATNKEILEFALRKEKCALHFYASMCRKRRLKAVRDIFCTISREEQKHVEWVRAEINAVV
ncbi:MAG: ferritin-like domain-containing protein [Spirochaetota bacterium]